MCRSAVRLSMSCIGPDLTRKKKNLVKKMKKTIEVWQLAQSQRKVRGLNSITSTLIQTELHQLVPKPGRPLHVLGGLLTLFGKKKNL